MKYSFLATHSLTRWLGYKWEGGLTIQSSRQAGSQVWIPLVGEVNLIQPSSYCACGSAPVATLYKSAD